MPSRAVTMTCLAFLTALVPLKVPYIPALSVKGPGWEGPAASGSQAGRPSHQVVLVFNVHLVDNVKN